MTTVYRLQNRYAMFVRRSPPRIGQDIIKCFANQRMRSITSDRHLLCTYSSSWQALMADPCLPFAHQRSRKGGAGGSAKIDDLAIDFGLHGEAFHKTRVWRCGDFLIGHEAARLMRKQPPHDPKWQYSASPPRFLYLPPESDKRPVSSCEEAFRHLLRNLCHTS